LSSRPERSGAEGPAVSLDRSISCGLPAAMEFIKTQKGINP
jgi:hypothetical protein